ncbi:hypothetical protein Q8F57_001125 [Paraburkholderia terrae]|uniref:hypothetical protein n=1 Tax=Paraburkholderia terrae TaxID=311230 RepID=UPI00296AF31E|nr:hypothetical protein [Paraburkholderia terrae]MDW3659287.1 hypothetical protein [Paraburkholderia terrae]
MAELAVLVWPGFNRSAKIEPLHAADIADLELILGCKVDTKAAPAIVNGWRTSSAASASRV